MIEKLSGHEIPALEVSAAAPHRNPRGSHREASADSGTAEARSSALAPSDRIHFDRTRTDGASSRGPGDEPPPGDRERNRRAGDASAAEAPARAEARTEPRVGSQDEYRPRRSDADGESLAARARELQRLRTTDREVRREARQHETLAGRLAAAGAKFDYEVGPDGRRYATEGDVRIRLSQGRTPEETLDIAEQAYRAATAPSTPSVRDRSLAEQAVRMMSIAKQRAAESRADAAELRAEQTGQPQPERPAEATEGGPSTIDPSAAEPSDAATSAEPPPESEAPNAPSRTPGAFEAMRESNEGDAGAGEGSAAPSSDTASSSEAPPPGVPQDEATADGSSDAGFDRRLNAVAVEHGSIIANGTDGTSPVVTELTENAGFRHDGTSGEAASNEAVDKPTPFERAVEAYDRSKADESEEEVQEGAADLFL